MLKTWIENVRSVSDLSDLFHQVVVYPFSLFQRIHCVSTLLLELRKFLKDLPSFQQVSELELRSSVHLSISSSCFSSSSSD